MSEDKFEIWLRKVCFQEPTKEAYDLSKDAWKEADAALRAENNQLKADKRELVELLEYFIDVIESNISNEVIKGCEDGVFVMSKAAVEKHKEGK